MSAAKRPERWAVDAGEADVAVLTIPAVLHHDRIFDLDVRMEVRVPDLDGATSTSRASHGLSVELDGRREWSRDIASSNPGQTDSLDYHCRREVPAGEPLRVRVQTRVQGVRRRSLIIEALESIDA